MRKIWLLLVFAAACGPSRLQKASPLPGAWQIEDVPNSLDQIGTVFSGSGKNKVYVADVSLKVKGGTGVVPTREVSKTYTIGALANFLKIQGLDSASIDVKDTITLTTSFDVKKAFYQRYSDDLQMAFQSQKKMIIDNLNGSSRKVRDLWFIAQLIKSPSVDITVNRGTDASGSVGVAFTTLLNFKPSLLRIKNADSTKLTYDLGDSLVVAYVLYPVNAKIVESSGAGRKDSVIDVNLGIPNN
jgi:hypothetical protein